MLPTPTLEKLREISKRLDFRCTDEELNIYKISVEKAVRNCNESMEKLETPSSRSPKKRNLGYRPNHSENPYNAWYWICNIKDSNIGLLADKKVGIKDSIAVAGVPMMIGCRALEGFVPIEDATVVQRILAAGGEIYGKTTCEDLCISDTSYATTYGPVKNPLNTDVVTGGSSSGSAAAVLCGNVDMALGTDQGGSIRVPCSFCGLVGMKPTFGLVPYTGCSSMLACVDHVGPMANSVKDCALLLETIAGFDDYKDCRQSGLKFNVPEYSKEIKKDIGKLKVGILQEAFDICQPDVVRCIQNALNLVRNSKKFASVEEISIPMHRDIDKFYDMVMLLGLYKQQVEGAGVGKGVYGVIDEQLSEKMYQALKSRSNWLHPTCKNYMLLAGYVYDEEVGHQFYAKGSSLAYQLRKEYDKIFETFDVIMLPTVPRTASKIQNENNLADYLVQTTDVMDNVRQFNLTHHPALTLNAGYSDLTDLPIGLQIVGKRWHDVTVLQAAAKVEKILQHLQKEF